MSLRFHTFALAKSLTLTVVLMSAALAQPLEATDSRGKSVVLASPAKRVAALSAFGADATLALGHEPVAVATYGASGLPSYLGDYVLTLPAVGPRHQPDLERLSKLGPDLLIGIKRYSELNADRLEEISPMLAFDLVTLQDSLDAMTQMGVVLGESIRAKELNAAFLKRLSQLSRTQPDGRQPTFALLTSSGEVPYIYHDHFLPAQLLIRAGYRNVGGELRDTSAKLPLGYRISLEALLEKDPDLIFVMPGDSNRAYMLNPIWPYLSAVKSNLIVSVADYWREPSGPVARNLILDDIELLISKSEE